MKTSMTVESFADQRKKHTDWRVVVKEFNVHTQQWEEIWSMVRSQPFTAIIETGGLLELENDRLKEVEELINK